jgi:PEP-CTERM motif
MKMKKLAASVMVLAACGFAGSASADFVVIDTGVDMIPGVPNPPNDADNLTEPFAALGLFPDATSIYTGDDDGILTPGEVLNFTDTGVVDISALVPLGGDVPAMEGYGLSWNMTATYSVGGTAMFVGAAPIDTTLLAEGALFDPGEGFIPTFTSGVVDIVFNDTFGLFGLAGGTTQVLQLDLVPPVTGVAPGNILLSGILDYSWYAPAGAPVVGTADWLVQNLFSFENGPSFYDLAGVGGIDIDWRADFNADPNLIPYNIGGLGNVAGTGLTAPACQEGQPTPTPVPTEGGIAVTAEGGELCRRTNLNMTIEFAQVPVPGTLALMGLGLVGFGVGLMRRRRSVA